MKIKVGRKYRTWTKIQLSLMGRRRNEVQEQEQNQRAQGFEDGEEERKEGRGSVKAWSQTAWIKVLHTCGVGLCGRIQKNNSKWGTAGRIRKLIVGSCDNGKSFEITKGRGKKGAFAKKNGEKQRKGLGARGP